MKKKTEQKAIRAEHTPGPWFHNHFFIESAGGPDIAEIGIKNEHGQLEENEAMYNAALIAAAPELLAAVRSMFLYIKTYGGEVTENFVSGNNGVFYENLIAKAEGRT